MNAMNNSNNSLKYLKIRDNGRLFVFLFFGNFPLLEKTSIKIHTIDRRTCEEWRERERGREIT